MRLADIGLDDKYDLDKTGILVTGIQAIVRAMLMQRARDARAGLNTAGYVSGYRGSPLGGIDQQFGRAGKLLAENNITFAPGLNEFTIPLREIQMAPEDREMDLSAIRRLSLFAVEPSESFSLQRYFAPIPTVNT